DGSADLLSNASPHGVTGRSGSTLSAAPGGSPSGQTAPSLDSPGTGRAPLLPRPRRLLRGSYPVLSDSAAPPRVPSGLPAARSVQRPKRSGKGRTRLSAGIGGKKGEGPSMKSAQASRLRRARRARSMWLLSLRPGATLTIAVASGLVPGRD